MKLEKDATDEVVQEKGVVMIDGTVKVRASQFPRPGSDDNVSGCLKQTKK